MKLATLPTLRILFEPADDGYNCLVCLTVVEPDNYGNPSCPDCGGPVRYFPFSVGTIVEAWRRQEFADDKADPEGWVHLPVSAAAGRIARDGLQPQLLAAAEDV